MKNFQLIVSTPDGNAFDRQVQMLSLRGVDGDLAVMAGHVPFCTAIKPGRCKIWTDDEDLTAVTDAGMLVVGQDKVILLVGSMTIDE
ncbi:MAG: FoF1 ATP synthase subunit delta/epsilon [Christensenellales bacterium]